MEGTLHERSWRSFLQGEEWIHWDSLNQNQLQSCAHIYSFAPSNENTRCKGSSGEIMEKTGEKYQHDRNQNEAIAAARTKYKTVHFASLMDLCNLKNSELELQYEKSKGRVVLQGDIVKDDSGSYAVFTEQGSSTSKMTAAKVMDINFKTTGMGRTSRRRCGGELVVPKGPDSSAAVRMAVVYLPQGRWRAEGSAGS